MNFIMDISCCYYCTDDVTCLVKVYFYFSIVHVTVNKDFQVYCCVSRCQIIILTIGQYSIKVGGLLTFCTTQGRSDGGYRDISPKITPSKLLWGKMTPERLFNSFIHLQKLLYPQNKFLATPLAPPCRYCIIIRVVKKMHIECMCECVTTCSTWLHTGRSSAERRSPVAPLYNPLTTHIHHAW